MGSDSNIDFKYYFLNDGSWEEISTTPIDFEYREVNMKNKTLKIKDLKVGKEYTLTNQTIGYIYKIDDDGILYYRSFGVWEESKLFYNSIVKHEFIEVIEYVSFDRALRHMQNGLWEMATLNGDKYTISDNSFWILSNARDERAELTYSQITSTMWELL